MTVSLQTISKRRTAFAAAKMLAHAGPVIVLMPMGKQHPLPANSTDTISFHRPRIFQAKTVPLQEGATPGADTFQYDKVTATIKQYGQVIRVTDQIQDIAEDPVVADISEQAGENIGRTLESITWGEDRAGTNVIYANGASRGAVNTAISKNLIRNAVRALERQKGMTIRKIIAPGIKYATRGVEPAYVFIGHTDLQHDIRELPNFTPVVEYSGMKMIHDQELGATENVRYILSPDLPPFLDAGGAKGSMISTSGTSADVYPGLILARDAFGCIPFKGMNMVKPFIKKPGEYTDTDPLAQRGFVSWKTYYTCKILNEAWMVRLEMAATDL